jgi:uncharacterized protein RhaS with RHS repeats
MRHRYYSPRLERFVNEDPIGTDGGLNTFAFVSNDPCNKSDQMGTNPCDTSFDERLTPEVVAQAKGFVAEADEMAESRDNTGMAYEFFGWMGRVPDGGMVLVGRGEWGRQHRFEIPDDAEGFAEAGAVVWHTHNRRSYDRVTGTYVEWDPAPSGVDDRVGRSGVYASFIFSWQGAVRQEFGPDGSVSSEKSCTW